jgi:hypothetical protein
MEELLKEIASLEYALRRLEQQTIITEDLISCKRWLRELCDIKIKEASIGLE